MKVQRRLLWGNSAFLIANMLGFGEKGYFESKPGADEPPVVE